MNHRKKVCRAKVVLSCLGPDKEITKQLSDEMTHARIILCTELKLHRKLKRLNPPSVIRSGNTQKVSEFVNKIPILVFSHLHTRRSFPCPFHNSSVPNCSFDSLRDNFFTRVRQQVQRPQTWQYHENNRKTKKNYRSKFFT